MPPLIGIDRGINGNLLKALEETGHGDQIVIVDPSYPLPEEAHVVDYQGDSSARALSGILRLVPREEDTPVTVMAADPPTRECRATQLFHQAVGSIAKVVEVPRQAFDAEDGTGFYDLANALETPTLFVRTRDLLPYACASFIVGHSQQEDSDTQSQAESRKLDGTLPTREIDARFNTTFLEVFNVNGAPTYAVTRHSMEAYFSQMDPSVSQASVRNAWHSLVTHADKLHNLASEVTCGCSLRALLQDTTPPWASANEKILGFTLEGLEIALPNFAELQSGYRSRRKMSFRTVYVVEKYMRGISKDDSEA